MRLNHLPVLNIALLLAALLPVASYAVEPQELNGFTGLTGDETKKLIEMKMKAEFSQAVDYMEKRIGQNEPTTSQLYELCQLSLQARLYGKMASCFDKLQRKSPDGRVLLKMHSMAPPVDVTSFAYSNMATGYTILGEYDKAIAAAKRALEGIDKGGFSGQEQEVLWALGYAHAMRGDKEQAREVAKKFASLKDDVAPGGTLLYQLNIYTEIGDFEKAWEIFEEFVFQTTHENGQLAKSLGAQVFEELKSSNSISMGLMRGHLLLGLGRVAEARQSFDAALADPRSSYAPSYEAFYDRGRIAEIEGKPTEAIEFYQRAVNEVERLRSSISSETAKISFVGNKQDIYGHLIKALIAAKRPGQALEYAERAKARALVDMLASREKLERPSSEISALLSTLNKLSADLATFNPEKATPEQAKKNQHTRSLAINAAEQLQKADYELASLVTVTGITEARLRGLLQPEETLVEYYYHGNDLYAFVATKSTTRAVRLEGAGISDAVRRFRAAVQNPKSNETTQLARELYDRLMAPLSLPAKGKLLVVPHGVLHYLPFNALSNGTDSVIDRYSLRLLPSASVMSFLNQRKASGNGLIIFGNPDLGAPQYDLPGAQKEAVEIARLRPGSTVLMRAEATKTAAKNLAGSFAYLHFASHGKFDPVKPLQSGIYLAKDKNTGTSGTLTVDELYSLNLNADLVTLSACETALGSIDNGDDVVGLTRGFFYAGVSSIISSLWEVEDNATYEMMTRFYGELGKTPKAEALRKAQLAVKAKFPHPFYWAAFQLTGNRQ